MAGGEFGELLAAHRARSGLTQAELAELAGVSERAIRALERGQVARPRQSSARLLATALGLTGDEQARFCHPDPAAPALQLPLAPANLAGRTGLIERLQVTVREGKNLMLAGPGGVGKTAALVKLAGALAPSFPDGVVYADLRGLESPLPVAAVLRHLLAMLGAAGQSLPDDEAGLAARFAGHTAKLRALIVLDDAANEAQLVPLLPRGPGCRVLAASRRAITGMADFYVETLGVLEPPDAIAMIGDLAGEERITGYQKECLEVAGYCGGLPLAIRIAAAKLSSRPQWTPADLARRLAAEQSRLDQLELGDLAVRTSIGLSEASLSPEAREILTFISLIDSASIPGWLIARLGGLTEAAAEKVCDELVVAQLLETLGYGDDDGERFRLHNLVRLYGREQAGAMFKAEEITEAVQRAIAAIKDVALASDHELAMTNVQPYGPLWSELRPASAQEPLTTLAQVYPLTAELLRLGEEHEVPGTWELAVALGPYQETYGLISDLISSARLVLRLAGGQSKLIALGSTGLANALLAIGSMEEAAHHYTSATELAQGDAFLFARAGLAYTAGYSGRWEEAREILAGVDAATMSDRPAKAVVWRALGTVHRRLGDIDIALDCFRQAAGGSGGVWEAAVQQEIARCEMALGNPAEARRILARVAGMLKEQQPGSPWHGAALAGLALACRDCGDLDAADDALTEGGAIFQQLGDQRWQAYVRQYRATVELRRGNCAAATAHLDAAELLTDDAVILEAIRRTRQEAETSG